jgi:UBX domain-containing protein 1
VDDGPYRRLDDPTNADFLRALAMGRTPPELSAEAESGKVVVGLVDKRDQDYHEEFRSFSGQGTSLGGMAGGAGNTFDPRTFAAESSTTAPVVLDESTPHTSIQVRLLNGQRRVIRINMSSTVADLAVLLSGDATCAFRLSSGFPPKPLDATSTIEAAGLKGAQVTMQKAD